MKTRGTNPVIAEIPGCVELSRERGAHRPSQNLEHWWEEVAARQITGGTAVVEADSLFVACPRCSAWPMAANVIVLDWRTDSEVRFRCPRCDHQVTALLTSPSRSKDQGMRNLKRPWTAEDDVRLRSLLEAGVSVLLVAAKLKRTTSAIKSR